MNDELYKRIEAIARQAIDERRDAAWYESEVRRLLMEYNIEERAAQLAKSVINAVRADKEAEFLRERSETVEVVTATLIQSQNNYTKGVLESIRRSMARGESDEVAIQRIVRLGKMARHHATTALNTGRAAIAREVTALRAAEAEVDPWMQYLYLGMFRSRKFCVENLFKVRRLSEWAQMKNQFGQPVHIFMGGYNCVHRLVLLRNYNPDTGEGAVQPKKLYKVEE